LTSVFLYNLDALIIVFLVLLFGNIILGILRKKFKKVEKFVKFSKTSKILFFKYKVVVIVTFIIFEANFITIFVALHLNLSYPDFSDAISAFSTILTFAFILIFMGYMFSSFLNLKNGENWSVTFIPFLENLNPEKKKYVFFHWFGFVKKFLVASFLVYLTEYPMI